MNTARISRYNISTDVYDVIALKKIIQGNFSKAYNEIGEFSYSIYVSYDTTDGEIGDFIQILIGNDLLCSGYIISITYEKNQMNITCFTEEYKLQRTRMPPEYTENLIGLNLETLAKKLSKQYYTKRYQDYSDFLEVFHSGFNVDIRDNINNVLYAQVPTYNIFSYQVIETYSETGEFLNSLSPDVLYPYDTIMIIDLHSYYFDLTKVSSAGITATEDIRNFLHCDTINGSQLTLRLYVDDYFYDVGLVMRQDGEVIANTSTGLIAGFEVVDNRNSKLKVYINSQHEDYESIIPVTIGSSPFYHLNGGNQTTDQQVFGGFRVQSVGSDYGTGDMGYMQCFLDLKAEYEDFKIERIRWSEKTKDEADNIFYEQRFDGVKLLANYVNTSGYDSNELIDDIDSVQLVSINFKYPNEYTELTGVLMPRENTSLENLYFTFFIPTDKYFIESNYSIPATRDSLPLFKFELLTVEILRAFEIIFYKTYLKNGVEIDTSLKSLVSFDFECNSNTNFEVLKSICDELNTRFYIENDKLFIKEIQSGTNTFYFAENINCEIDSVEESDDQRANQIIFEGIGTSKLDKPYVSYNYSEGLTQNIKTSNVIKTSYKTTTQLLENTADYQTNYNESTKNISLRTNLRSLGTIPKIGDTIYLKMQRINKNYDDLELKEVNFDFNDEDCNVNLTIGNRNKKLR